MVWGLRVRFTFWIACSLPTVATMRAGDERRLSPTTIPVTLSTVITESGERKNTGVGRISAPLKLKAWTTGRITEPVGWCRVCLRSTGGGGKSQKVIALEDC